MRAYPIKTNSAPRPPASGIVPQLFLRNNSPSLYFVPPFLVALSRALGGAKWGDYRGHSSLDSFLRINLPQGMGGTPAGRTLPTEY